MKENSVTIIIPVKNGLPLFRDVLDGIKAQVYDGEVEVLCIDSGSKDGSDALVENYGHRLMRIEPKEFGHGRTRNFAAQQSRSQFRGH